MVRRSGPGLQDELLRLLQPWIPRRDELISERVAPTLASIGDSMAGLLGSPGRGDILPAPGRSTAGGRRD